MARPLMAGPASPQAAALRALATALRAWADGPGRPLGIAADVARETATEIDATADAVHGRWRPDDALARVGASIGALYREICYASAAQAGVRVTRRLLDAVRERRR